MISIKKTLYKAIKALPKGDTIDSWMTVTFNGYFVCAQLFNLTPVTSGSNAKATRTVTLPVTCAVSGSTVLCYPIVALVNSKPEVNTCVVSGNRNTATTVDLYIYASNTTTRTVTCLVFGKLA